MSNTKVENGQHFRQIGNQWYTITSPAALHSVSKASALPVTVHAGGGFGGGLSQRTDAGTLIKAYHTWVARAVQIKAEAVAKQGVLLYVDRGGNERELVDMHPLLDVLYNPNPIQTRYDLWELTISYLELAGNAYWFKARDRLGVVRELWPVRPDLMRPVPDKDEILKGYLYRFQGKEIAYEVNEIVHFMYPNPESMYIGMGTLEKARYLYDADKFMRDYGIASYRNMARPDGVLETDMYLQQEDIEILSASWDAAYGGARNARRLAVLQAGAKYKAISVTPQELDFLESQKASKVDIFEMFGIPRPVAGITDDVNRANAEASKAVFAENTLVPILCKVQERLTKSLALDVDMRLYFEFEDPVPEDLEFKLKERESNLKNYVTTINEERAETGREAVDWGDRPLVPFNLVPLGSENGDNQLAAPAVHVKMWTRSYIKDENIRLRVWQEHKAIAVAQERLFRRGLRPLFRGQRNEVLSNLRQHRSKADETFINSVLFDADEWLRKFGDQMELRFVEAVRAGAKKALRDLASETFDIDSPLVKMFLKDKTFKFSFQTNNTTETALRNELAAGLDAGETLDDLTQRVQKVFDFAEGFRSRRIAVTEMNTSANFGVHDAFRQNDVGQKNWLSQRDGDARQTHLIDSEIVGLNERFSNGLLYPGDPDGSASEIINCRCTILPVIE